MLYVEGEVDWSNSQMALVLKSLLNVYLIGMEQAEAEQLVAAAHCLSIFKRDSWQY